MGQGKNNRFGNLGIILFMIVALLFASTSVFSADYKIQNSSSPLQSYMIVEGSTGDIGIGTNNPTYRLHINDTSGPQLLLDGYSPIDGAQAGAGALVIGKDAAYQGKVFYNWGAGDLYIENTYNSNNGDIKFRTKTASTAVNAMVITGDGKVGIGTYVPGYSLDVMGQVNGSGFCISGDCISDWDSVNSSTGNLSGTAGTGDFGYLPYFEDSSSFSQSTLTYNSTNGNLGVGSVPHSTLAAYPTYPLLIGGAIRLTSNSGLYFNSDSVRLRRSGNSIFMETSGTGQLRFYTAGSERLTIDDGGAIGITENSPDLKFEINTWEYTEGDYFGISSNGNGDGDIFIVTNTSRVGIGTTEPEVALQVEGTASATAFNVSDIGSPTTQGLLLADNTSGRKWMVTADTAGQFNLRHHSGSSWSTALIVNTAGAIYAGDGSVGIPGYGFYSDTDSGLYRAGADQIGLSTGGTARLMITSDGDVGIGNNNPSYKLDVNGTTRIYEGSSGATAHTAYDSLVIEDDAANGLSFLVPDGQSSRISFGDASNNNIGQLVYDHADNSFSIYNNGARNFYLTNAGTLGIGTTLSTYKLNVAGQINGSGYCIDDVCIDGWSDVNSSSTPGMWTNVSGNATFMTGNVGIGTTTPSTKLDVNGSLNISGTGAALYFSDGSNITSGESYSGYEYYSYHAKSCYDNETYVNMSTYLGGKGLCVENEVRNASSTWYNAWQACVDDGKRLMDYMEWRTICIYNHTDIKNMTGVLEWASSTPSVVTKDSDPGAGALLGGGTGCDKVGFGWVMKGDGDTDANAFRCVR